VRLPIRSSLHKPAVLALVLTLIAGSALFAVTQNDGPGTLRNSQTVGDFDPVRRAFQSRDEARTALELAMRFLQHPSGFSFNKAREQVEKTQKAANEAQAAYAQAKADEFAAQRAAQEHPDNPALKQAYETMKAGADLAKQVADQTLQVSKVASQLLSSAGAAFFPQKEQKKDSDKSNAAGEGKDGDGGGGKDGDGGGGKYTYSGSGGGWVSGSNLDSSYGYGTGGTRRWITSSLDRAGEGGGGGSGGSGGGSGGGGRSPSNGPRKPADSEETGQARVLVPDDGGFPTGAGGASLTDPAAILAAVQKDSAERKARALDPSAGQPLTDTVEEWKQLVVLLQDINDRNCKVWADLEVARQQAEQDLAASPDDAARKQLAEQIKTQAEQAKAYCEEMKVKTGTVEIEQAITRRASAATRKPAPAPPPPPPPPPANGGGTPAPPVGGAAATPTTAATPPDGDGGQPPETTAPPPAPPPAAPEVPDEDAALASWNNALVDLAQKRLAADNARSVAERDNRAALAAAVKTDKIVTDAANLLADPSVGTTAKQDAINAANKAVEEGQRLFALADSEAVAARDATIAEINAEDAANSAGAHWVNAHRAAAGTTTTTTQPQPTTTQAGETTTSTTAPPTTTTLAPAAPATPATPATPAAPTTTAPPPPPPPPPAPTQVPPELARLLEQYNNSSSSESE
jgi:hypothetical protein